MSPPVKRMGITTAQIRGARGILNWSQSELAERTGISATSIGSIENGISTARANTLITIQKSFEDAGIEFVGLDGIKLRSGHVRVFRGHVGIVEFFDDVYASVQGTQSDVLCSNVDERLFVRAMGEQTEDHITRMNSLNRTFYKILIQDGDTYMPAAAYAEYRWIPEGLFASVPFYVYADKFAIILFDGEINVIVMDYPSIANAYRKQFQDIWVKAMPIPASDNMPKKANDR